VADGRSDAVRSERGSDAFLTLGLGCRLVHPVDNYDGGGAMIEKIWATCLGLRQLKQQNLVGKDAGFILKTWLIMGMGSLSGVRRIRQKSEMHVS
jgi:hypothetical protein